MIFPRNMPKDYYVGVKLNVMNTDNRYNNIDIDSITQATIYGYCTYNDLSESRTWNPGEFLCKSAKLDSLRNIGDIINKIK